ncbi:hypothetical protein FB466_0285 [Klugiella xanthotipulae]|uniref:Uncharacterized protein n=1 Tax=Klugiella xanthotipulae TaxID=244735 RepID=A0A543I4K5_9MICO|nr:hypothetical protein FB466_0285 [Klugiella xanthotipulae]
MRSIPPALRASFTVDELMQFLQECWWAILLVGVLYLAFWAFKNGIFQSKKIHRNSHPGSRQPRLAGAERSRVYPRFEHRPPVSGLTREGSGASGWVEP